VLFKTKQSENKMNKAQFVDLVQASGSYKTKVEAETAIKAVTDAITTALTAKEDVSLIGFGSFKAALQKGKEGTVPGTTKTYKTEDRHVPKFKAASALLEVVATNTK
jgi:DNA-binding protein HU-beta